MSIDALADRILAGLTDEEQWGLAVQLRTELEAYGDAANALLARIPVPEKKVVLDDGSSINRRAASTAPAKAEVDKLKTGIDPKLFRLFPPEVTAKNIETVINLARTDPDLCREGADLEAAYTAVTAEAATAADGKASHSISVNKERVAEAAEDILSSLLPQQDRLREVERELEPVGRLPYTD